MQTRHSSAFGAPAPVAQGYHPTLCILSDDALHQTIHQAKTDLKHKGRGNAYARLLKQFHAMILPAFIAETGGNLSEMSRLLGIHRETVRDYVSRLESVGGAQ